MEAHGRNNTLVYAYTAGNTFPPPMLQYTPVRWVAFVMAALFPALAVRALVAARAARVAWLGAAGAAGAALELVALILRGSAAGDDAVRMYAAQMALHLSGGVVLAAAQLALTGRWIGGAGGAFLAHLGATYAVVAGVCACVGVPLEFVYDEGRRASGYRLTEAALIATLALAPLGAALAAYHTDDPRQLLARAGGPAVLLSAWASFALARTTLAMDDIANTSEALFYCLSVLPLGAVLGAWGALEEEEEEEGGCGCGPSRNVAAPSAACTHCAYEERLWQAVRRYA
ncbi:hypothetical protein GGF46_001101 [Coemansia sp. RSA 552]|nr:hypothetical protein GGF46_001101 [Coemansia sp. RSA 552]